MWGTDNSLLSLMSISAYTTYLTTKYTKILTLSTKSYKKYARFNLIKSSKTDFSIRNEVERNYTYGYDHTYNSLLVLKDLII